MTRDSNITPEDAAPFGRARHTFVPGLMVGIALAAIVAFDFFATNGGSAGSVVAGAAAGVLAYLLARVRPVLGIAALGVFMLIALAISRASWLVFFASMMAVGLLLSISLPVPQRSAGARTTSRLSREAELVSGIVLLALGLVIASAVVGVVVSELPYLVDGAEASATIEQVDTGPTPAMSAVRYRFSVSGQVVHGVANIPAAQLDRPVRVVYVVASPTNNQPRSNLLLLDSPWQVVLGSVFAVAVVGAGSWQIRRRVLRRP